MIANSWTSSNKLKASKGYKDSEGVRLLDVEEKLKISETNEVDKERSHPLGRSSSSQNLLYGREKSDHNKFKPRFRNRDDYRMGRGGLSDRRGSFRGRGGTYRRSERDVESGYFPRGKFYEPLNKGKTSNSMFVSSAGKHNDFDNCKSKSGMLFKIALLCVFLVW